MEFDAGIMLITNQEVSDITVTFVLNGGTMDGQTGTVEGSVVNHKAEEPDPAPTRDGYTFGGWYSDKELTHEFDFDTDLIIDQRLYAKWTKEWTVEKVWNISEAEEPPESVDVILQKKDQYGRPSSTIDTLTLNEDNEWEGSFTIPTGAAEIDPDHYIIRERDGDNTIMYDNNDDAAFEETPTAYFDVNGRRTGYQVRNEMNAETGHMKITNSSVKEYSFEISWDIDLGQTDRPDEIEVALQKKTGKIQYETLQVVTVGPDENWSGRFEPVPIGQVNASGVFESFTYRIREIKPPGQGEQRPQDENEYHRSCDSRTVHDTYDFDRPGSVKIHLYAKEKDSSEKKELSVSPITLKRPADGGDDWPWSVEVPLNEIAVIEEDKENAGNTKVTYKEIVIEEEVPNGYEATYDGYDITNKKDGIETISISGRKTWDDDNNAEKKRPSSITIRLLGDNKEKASRKVTAADGWKWTFKDMPKYKNDGKTEIYYEIQEDPVKDYRAFCDENHYNVTNELIGPKPVLTIWVDGNADSRVYDGSEQNFTGSFTASSYDTGFDPAKFSYSGNKTASGTGVGTYETEPVEAACSYSDDKYKVVWVMGDPLLGILLERLM